MNESPLDFVTVSRTPRGQWCAELRRWSKDADSYVVAKCTEPFQTIEGASFIARQWARDYKLLFTPPLTGSEEAV